MTRLYIWKPNTLPEMLTNGIMPDVGHAAMEVVAPNGDAGYISYWPETESLLGRAIAPFKPRETRHPSSYAQECDPEQGYMQRPADYEEDLTEGLDEERILRLWPQLRDSEYDLRSWNCSNVIKYLLIGAVPREDREAIAEACACSAEDLRHVTDVDDFKVVLTYLSTSRFIDCRPDDVRRLAHTYNERIASVASALAATNDAETPAPTHV
jgi:hypothetical protein